MTTPRKPAANHAAAMRKAFDKASWRGELRRFSYLEDEPWLAFRAGAAWQRRQQRRP